MVIVLMKIPLKLEILHPRPYLIRIFVNEFYNILKLLILNKIFTILNKIYAIINKLLLILIVIFLLSKKTIEN